MEGNKGFNTIVDETKKELAALINNKLSVGLPSSVIQLMLENLVYEIKQVVKYDKKQELERFNKENSKDNDGQVEWHDPVDQEVVDSE